MIKKAALIVATFGLLVGAHIAYVQGFAMIANHLAARDDMEAQLFDLPESQSSIRSKQLALENFGPAHFTSKAVKLTYYDQSRGSYMYAQDYTMSADSKVMMIKPFAMISVSKDSKTHKTVTSDEAIIVFNKPYSLISKSAAGSDPQRVVHAELIGNVRIRDDKGTAENSMDDMLIGPMTRIEFDEKTMQITTKSDVVIQDQDMTITGTEMMIQLRHKNPVLPGTLNTAVQAPPSGKSSGFEAQTAFLYKNVHIKINNVTPGGILPGQSKPDAQGQTPLDLTCLGEMRIDMPKPEPEPAVGPPNPYRDPEPTYARFEKKVRVVRGVTSRDWLYCDRLNLTLKPDRKSPTDPAPVDVAATNETTAGGDQPPAATGGPMTQLKLRTALAQGDEVRVQSESQGLLAQCTELKYDKKLAEGQPDKTYLNGGLKRKLWVEKTDLVSEGPKAGSVKSVMRLNSLDAEILDYGLGVNRIVARGPGKTEDRPSRNESVTQVAYFEDQMILVTTREAGKPAPDAVDASATAAPVAPLRRVVTLTGPSKLVDFKSATTLDAKEKIVAEFESGPKTGAGNGGDGPSRIKWLQAYDNAHITTPGRTLTAYRKFEAWFVQPPTPVVAANNGSAAASSPAAPLLVTTAPETPLLEATPEAPPAPVEGAVDGRANYVHATIVQGANNGKSELREAFLRGDVVVHQDPNPGEFFGKNASGEALDLFNQGKGLMKFAVSTEDPQSNKGTTRTKLATSADAARSRLTSRSRGTGQKPLARVEFDGKIIESEKIIWLDQLANYAYSQGHGSLVQVASAGLLDDKGLASSRPKSGDSKAPGARDPLTIFWNEEMKFYGRSHDKQNREVAKAEFRGTSEEVQTPDGKVVFRRGVEAVMKEASITCDTMDVYMDKTIDFSKAKPVSTGPKPAPDLAAASKPDEKQAEIAMLECWGDNAFEDRKMTYAGVDITSVKFFPETKILRDKYRIRHTHVIYDKRTGDFEGSGPGTVFLYQGSLPKANGPTVRTTSATTASKGTDSTQHTMKLTKIQFAELMKGRMGIYRDGANREPQIGEFVGNVQTANAIVATGGSDIDFDRLEQDPDAVFLTSDVLRIRSEPAPIGSKADDRKLLFGSGNAAVRSVDRVVQGDRIVYDSGTELMYAYGDNGKDVVLVEQKSPGQPASRSYGRSLFGNKLTRQFQMVDPQNIQLYDIKSGDRPRPAYPDLGGSPAKPEIKPQQRMKYQRPARNSTERSGFTGH